MENELESATKELKLLAVKQFITSVELERAKVLMVQLKESGMTNVEISKLADERWSESTIKGYTRGVPARPSPPWESAIALFNQLLSKGLALKDIEETIRLEEQLHHQKMSITELLSFTTELEAQGINAASFIGVYWDWIGAGVKLSDVASVLKLKGEVEDAGLSLDLLTKMGKLAGNFGNADIILDALTKFGSILELEQEKSDQEAKIEEEKRNAQDRLDKLDTEIAAKQQTLQDLQASEEEAKEALGKCQSLVDRGFDLSFLQQVTEAAEKYASPLELLEAVNSFSSLNDIRAKCDEASCELQNNLAALNNVKDDHSHLRAAIEIVEKLMDEFGLRLTGISTMLSVAEKYGHVAEVLEAIESYGGVQMLQEKVGQQELRVTEAQAKIKRLQKAESEVKARIQAALDLLEPLNSKALEVGRAIGADEEQMRRSRRFSRILALLENPTKANYEESAPHVLALANVIHTFVRVHKDKFITQFTITQALESLMRDLGQWQG